MPALRLAFLLWMVFINLLTVSVLLFPKVLDPDLEQRLLFAFFAWWLCYFLSLAILEIRKKV
jgi:hypothetical protein